MHLTRLQTLFLSVQAVKAGSMVTISDWGDNPTGLQLSAYIPSILPGSPPLVLALHGCGGSGTLYASTTKYQSYADQGGFIVAYPSSPHDSNCWDVASNKTLTHLGGGDSNGLINMVQYFVTKYHVDPTKVFATGSSSGCMMSNVLAAVYPDVIAATSCYSGVAAGCLAGSPGSSPISANQTCAQGKVIKTGQQWAAQVKAMYPGYTGSYPRMQIWHGTIDTFVNYPNFAEELKEWSTLLGVSFSKNVTDTPESGYTQMVYGDGTKLVGYNAKNVGHTVPVHELVDLKWFGLAS